MPEDRSLAGQIESLTKIGLLLIGALYVLGFAVNALYLARFGVSPMSLVRAQYILAGLWLVAPFGVAAILVAIVTYAVGEELETAGHGSGKPSYLKVALGAATIVGGVVILSTLALANIELPSSHAGVTFAVGRRVAARLTLFVLLLTVCGGGTIAALRRRVAVKWIGHVGRLVGLAALGLIFLAGYVGYFAANVYPLIPALIGGGAPVRVELTLKDGTRRVAPLLLANEQTVIILDPRQKAVELKRDEVASLTYEP